jgi:FtsH-binding integral membrane protein
MSNLEMTPQSAFTAAGAVTAERVTAFLRKVYGWMFVGLGVTAAVALAVAGSPSIAQAVFANRFLFGLMIAELDWSTSRRRTSCPPPRPVSSCSIRP